MKDHSFDGKGTKESNRHSNSDSYVKDYSMRIQSVVDGRDVKSCVNLFYRKSSRKFVIPSHEKMNKNRK